MAKQYETFEDFAAEAESNNGRVSSYADLIKQAAESDSGNVKMEILDRMKNSGLPVEEISRMLDLDMETVKAAVPKIQMSKLMMNKGVTAMTEESSTKFEKQAKPTNAAPTPAAQAVFTNDGELKDE